MHIRPIPVGRHSSVVATCFVATGGECKASVLDKLYNLLYHVFVRQESEQLAGEATVPDCVISRSQIYKTWHQSFFLLMNGSQYFGSAKLYLPRQIPASSALRSGSTVGSSRRG